MKNKSVFYANFMSSVLSNIDANQIVVAIGITASHFGECVQYMWN